MRLVQKPSCEFHVFYYHFPKHLLKTEVIWALSKTLNAVLLLVNACFTVYIVLRYLSLSKLWDYVFYLYVAITLERDYDFLSEFIALGKIQIFLQSDPSEEQVSLWGFCF